MQITSNSVHSKPPSNNREPSSYTYPVLVFDFLGKVRLLPDRGSLVQNSLILICGGVSGMLKKLEHILEVSLFNSRWLLAPFYLGLVGGIVILLVTFAKELYHIFSHLMTLRESEVIVASLTLVDLTLVGSLLLMVIFAGYENFVSKIDVAGHEDRPEWMGKVDYAGLKIKLIASIVAISGIELLKAFVNLEGGQISDRDLAWKVGIHMTFVISGVLLALMDRIEGKHGAPKHLPKDSPHS